MGMEWKATVKASWAVLALVTGCATRPHETPQQFAARIGSPALCYVNYAGNADDKRIASLELAQRAFVCKDQDIRDGMIHWQQMQAEAAQMEAQRRGDARRRADAAMGLGMGLLLAPTLAPPVAAPSPPITCYTTGNGRTTTCQ